MEEFNLIEEIMLETLDRMKKSLLSFSMALAKIRTGRAHPSILDSIKVDYYGSQVSLTQVANVVVEDARTLTVTPWEKQMVVVIERALMISSLGINPSTAGSVIRVPMPPLTEETRRSYVKQARSEAENARVAVRNIRRDSINNIRGLSKEKEISEDIERKKSEEIQNITNKHIRDVDRMLSEKENGLMEL